MTKKLRPRLTQQQTVQRMAEKLDRLAEQAKVIAGKIKDDVLRANMESLSIQIELLEMRMASIVCDLVSIAGECEE